MGAASGTRGRGTLSPESQSGMVTPVPASYLLSLQMCVLNVGEGERLAALVLEELADGRAQLLEELGVAGVRLDVLAQRRAV